MSTTNDMPTPEQMAIRDVVATQLDDRYRDWEPTEYTRREPDGALSLAYRYAATPYDNRWWGEYRPDPDRPHRVFSDRAFPTATEAMAWCDEQAGAA